MKADGVCYTFVRINEQSCIVFWDIRDYDDRLPLPELVRRAAFRMTFADLASLQNFREFVNKYVNMIEAREAPEEPVENKEALDPEKAEGFKDFLLQRFMQNAVGAPLSLALTDEQRAKLAELDALIDHNDSSDT